MAKASEDDFIQVRVTAPEKAQMLAVLAKVQSELQPDFKFSQLMRAAVRLGLDTIIDRPTAVLLNGSKRGRARTSAG